MTEPLKHGSLFSGIGGFELAAEAVGWQNVFSVEHDEFCSKILQHHFPLTKHYNDIKQFDAKPYKGSIDIITGGFPCQPFSTAGKRGGVSDNRYLWPEMLRVIREVRPRFVVAENVRGLVNWSEGMVFETVLTDLEGEGFEVFPVVLPAASVNAPHRRDRIWIVAYAHDQGGAVRPEQVQGTHGEVPQRHNDAQSCNAGAADATNADAIRLQIGENAGEMGGGQSQVRGEGHQPTEPIKATGAAWDAPNANGSGARQDYGQGESGQPDQTRPPTNWQDFPTVAPLCGGDDGLPKELDGITFPKWRRQSIKAYGNAIVPQVALQIFKAIQQSL